MVNGALIKAKLKELKEKAVDKFNELRGYEKEEEEDEEDPDISDEERAAIKAAKEKEARRRAAAKKGKILVEQKEVRSGGIGRAQFIYHHGDEMNIRHYYDLEKKRAGEGSFAVVQKANNRSTGAQRAIKVISKGQMKCADRFHAEIQIMKLLDHPNIIKLYESFEDKKNIYVVMECCNGGELFDKVIENGHLTEVQSAIIMQQILRGVYYMHSMGVIHRDIKPENYLFLNEEPIEKGNSVKCIDFGLSRTFGKDDAIRTKVGTPYYCSPQVLAGKYDQKADMWSCGALLYVMLCGYPPFYGETDADILTKVRMGNFSFNSADWKNVSSDGKNLVRMLLKMNPYDRFSAEQALNFSWIKDKAPRPAHISLGDKFMTKLRNFARLNRLKRAALHVIASQLPEDQIQLYKDTFTQMDTNGDGMLTLAEFEAGLKWAGMKELPTDLAEVMDVMDQDGSGAVDYTEFIAACLEEEDYTNEEVCWGAFRVFDKTGDGMVSRHELEEILAANEEEEMDQKWIDDIMAVADTSALSGSGLEGEIDFNEFLSMMRGKQYTQCVMTGKRQTVRMECAVTGARKSIAVNTGLRKTIVGEMSKPKAR